MPTLTRYPNMKPYEMVDVPTCSYASISISFTDVDECRFLNRLNCLCNEFGFSRSDVIKAVLFSVFESDKDDSLTF